MQLLRSRKALEEFQELINKTIDIQDNSKLEMYVIQIFIIIFYAEIDNKIREFFKNNLSKYTFVDKYFKENDLKRRTNLTDVVFLLRGIESAKEIYNDKEYEKLRQWFDFRHSIAHELNKPQKTFKEVYDDNIIEIAEKILNKLNPPQ